MLRAVAGLLLLLTGAASLAQVDPHPDYVNGYCAWTAQHWSAASESLSRYWNAVPFGRTYDVAYWLGTSWCRQSGAELPGADLLDWSYHFHSMPEATRMKFRQERDLCLHWLNAATSQRSAPTIVLAGAWTSATARASGKTFYLGNQDKGGLTAYPVRVKHKLDDAVFAARLVEVGNPDAIAQALLTRAPQFKVHVGRQFAIASAVHDDAQLKRIAEQLDRFAVFLQGEFALPAPGHYITIYLFPDIPQLRVWADRLHGLDASPMTLGYSLQNDLSVLAMVPSTQVGTILHELFHLLLRGAYGDAPQWLDEGMASLYETSTFSGGRYHGAPNWRSPVFAEFSHVFPRMALHDVITSPWFSDEPSLAAWPGERRLGPDEQAYMLAYARMFMLYLQEAGMLTRVLQTYQQRQTPAQFTPAPAQSVALLEKALGKPLPEIEQAFRTWAPKASKPDTRLDAQPANAPAPANAIDR
ncbi:MAG: hypothetical protein H7A12_00345 [Pseudomonadales bacterium]|jgi:hypothetical protein|nr:hypothetical protein [Pseudomonadales bacterium]MCP5319278.1 hypothetical protein [Pseudomonadales bacterium]MCP5338378.1 hypothetical protein [Pseudomonadales bacterium]